METTSGLFLRGCLKLQMWQATSTKPDMVKGMMGYEYNQMSMIFLANDITQFCCQT